MPCGFIASAAEAEKVDAVRTSPFDRLVSRRRADPLIMVEMMSIQHASCGKISCSY